MLLTIIPKNIQGMTTLEVITVLIITGILAAVSIPSLDKAMKRAELNTAADDVEAISQKPSLMLFALRVRVLLD